MDKAGNSNASKMKRAFAAIASFVCPSSLKDKLKRKADFLTNSLPSPQVRYKKRRKIDDKNSKNTSRSDRTLTPTLLIPSRDECAYLPSPSSQSSSTCLNEKKKSFALDKSEHGDTTNTNNIQQSQSNLLTTIPPDVLSHCFLFLPTSSRKSLPCVCRQFLEVCNSRQILRNLELGGEPLSGRGGFILDYDTRETAIKRLSPLARAGNLQACHMIGIIKAYCYDDVATGVHFLRAASNSGYVRSAYALGLLLRDTYKEESIGLLVRAANESFLPALQELLPAKEMKEKYGEPSAEELGTYFDSVGLGRLLRKNYSQYPRVLNASHCWNPHCGKWAYKSHGRPISGMDLNKDKTNLGFNRNITSNELAITYQTVSTFGSNNAKNKGFAFVSQQLSKKNENRSDADQKYRCLYASNSLRLSRMKMCSSCRRAKYCSKLCQVYDWRSGRHKKECRRI